MSHGYVFRQLNRVVLITVIGRLGAIGDSVGVKLPMINAWRQRDVFIDGIYGEFKRLSLYCADGSDCKLFVFDPPAHGSPGAVEVSHSAASTGVVAVRLRTRRA